MIESVELGGEKRWDEEEGEKEEKVNFSSSSSTLERNEEREKADLLLLKEILHRCLYFLCLSSLSGKVLVVKIMIACFQRLNRRKLSLYPLAHDCWQPIIDRMKDLRVRLILNLSPSQSILPANPSTSSSSFSLLSFLPKSFESNSIISLSSSSPNSTFSLANSLSFSTSPKLKTQSNFLLDFSHPLSSQNSSSLSPSISLLQPTAITPPENPPTQKIQVISSITESVDDIQLDDQYPTSPSLTHPIPTLLSSSSSSSSSSSCPTPFLTPSISQSTPPPPSPPYTTGYKTDIQSSEAQASKWLGEAASSATLSNITGLIQNHPVTSPSPPNSIIGMKSKADGIEEPEIGSKRDLFLLSPLLDLLSVISLCSGDFVESKLKDSLWPEFFPIFLYLSIQSLSYSSRSPLPHTPSSTTSSTLNSPLSKPSVLTKNLVIIPSPNKPSSSSSSSVSSQPDSSIQNSFLSFSVQSKITQSCLSFLLTLNILPVSLTSLSSTTSIFRTSDLIRVHLPLILFLSIPFLSFHQPIEIQELSLSLLSSLLTLDPPFVGSILGSILGGILCHQSLLSLNSSDAVSISSSSSSSSSSFPRKTTSSSELKALLLEYQRSYLMFLSHPNLVTHFSLSSPSSLTSYSLGAQIWDMGIREGMIEREENVDERNHKSSSAQMKNDLKFQFHQKNNIVNQNLKKDSIGGDNNLNNEKEKEVSKKGKAMRRGIGASLFSLFSSLRTQSKPLSSLSSSTSTNSSFSYNLKYPLTPIQIKREVSAWTYLGISRKIENEMTEEGIRGGWEMEGKWRKHLRQWAI